MNTATAGSPVRLDKLRGYGPWFAFASPFFFVMSFVYLMVIFAIWRPTSQGPPPGWFGWMVAGWLLIWALFLISAFLVALDLEWIEHPVTHTPMTYVGLGGAAVATAAFFAILIEGFVNVGGFTVGATLFVLFAGLGVYLVVMNVVGRRAGLLGRGLPWLGITCGGCFLLAAVSSLVGTGGLAAVVVLPAVPLYLAWSVWLGFHLRSAAARVAIT